MYTKKYTFLLFNGKIDKLQYFVRVFVFGLGFMSGFWIAIGVDPEAAITNAFSEAANSVLPGSGIFIWLMPVISSVISVGGAYALGGGLGLIAVAIAFAGGAVLLANPLVSLIIMGVAIILGLIASNE
jgi:hypothetical protein